jgi:hypothetical protein
MKTTTKKLELKENQFLVDSNLYVQERTGNYNKQESIIDKWEYSKGGIDNSNGNINSETSFDIERQEIVFISYDEKKKLNLSHDDEFKRFIGLYRVISSPLALYRLISLFFEAPKTRNYYKFIWQYTITHKGTGKKVTFSEWKGAFGFWLPEYTHTQLPSKFKKDLKELITHLISNEIAHPYDELVSGSVA